MIHLRSSRNAATALLFCGAALAAEARDPNPPSIYSTSGAWPIHRQWTPAETAHYAAWVEHIFIMKTTGTVEQRTAKLARVLTDPEMNLLEDPRFRGEGSNPQLAPDIVRSMHGVMDCGKFTAFMPAYYAYRRGLPWMTAIVRSGGGDVRTSEFNVPSGATNSFTCSSPGQFFRNAVGSFISGNYRVNLDGPNADQSDTVPVALNRQYLLPGCINYIDGHVLLLARVSEYGELQFLNCSTTPTRDIFTYNGMNTVTGITPRSLDPRTTWDGCFQGMRVPRYPIAETNSDGRVTSVRRRTNEEMKEFGFSTEQYDVMRQMYEHQYIEEAGLKVPRFLDFLRLRMKSVDTIAPLAFMEAYAGEILDAYRIRRQFVEDAWRNVRANGWITYPEELSNENIFQAAGRWETWSSPSSDVDRRNKYFYLADWLDFAIRQYGLVPEFIDLEGLEGYAIESQADLAAALLAEKKRIFAEHSMTYTNSAGDPVSLTLLDIEKRLYDLSFDPNHPPELRWGAPEGSEERATAPQTWTPVPHGTRVAMEDAYRWQAYYRSLGQRETSSSSLREMFTEGFPVRDKLDAQIARWLGSARAVAAGEILASERTTAPQAAVPTEVERAPILLQHAPALTERTRPAPQERPDPAQTSRRFRR